MHQNVRAGRTAKTAIRRRDRGSVMVLVAIALVALVGVAALAVDLGQAHIAKQRLHDVCDAAALAAAWALEFGGEVDQLAQEAATEIFAANNPDLPPPTVTVETTAEGTTVTVTGSMTVNFGFASVLDPDFRSETISASSKALLESMPKFEYQFVPLALSDWQIQPFRVESNGDPTDYLKTPYWIRGTDEFGLAGQPNLIPVTFGDRSYDGPAYESMLKGTSPAFSMAVGGSVRLIENNIVNATSNALTDRVQNDNRKWNWWKDASNLDKATSKRIVIFPVVDNADIARIRREAEAGEVLDDRMTVVGFAGFLIDHVYADSGPGPDGRIQQWANLYGYFVPGIVGRKSIRWMEQFENYTQSNLMYRVRLIK